MWMMLVVLTKFCLDIYKIIFSHLKAIFER